MLKELQHHLQGEIARLEDEKVLCKVNLDSVEEAIHKWIEKHEKEDEYE